MTFRPHSILKIYLTTRQSHFSVLELVAGLTGFFDGENYNTSRYSHRPNSAIGLASIQGENCSEQFIALLTGDITKQID